MPAQPFNPVVVAPTYNNARTLGDIVRGVAAIGLPLLVVNDGSTDATASVLEAIRGEHAPDVLTHPRNRGKAAALRTGFAAARGAGYTHAVSIDTDGQHDPREILKLLERARETPNALVLGLRDEAAEGYPSKSKLGRRLSNLLIRMESDLRVEDSQCGMRVYPLGLVGAVPCRAGRFGFETEIVTRAAWAGCPIAEVPVACRYLPPGERVSHLNPLLDTLRHMGMHARLLGRAMLPWPRHPQWPSQSTDVTTMPRGARRGWGRRFWNWINPAEAWRQARRDRVSRETFAAGLAVGAFIGNLPVYGLHAWIGLYAARRLHLNPIAVFAGTNVSIPPIGPLLNVAAVALGFILLHGSLPTAAEFNFDEMSVRTLLPFLQRRLLEWVVGSPIVGLACAGLVFWVSNRALPLASAGEAAITSEKTPSPPRSTPESSATHPAGPASGHAA